METKSDKDKDEYKYADENKSEYKNEYKNEDDYNFETNVNRSLSRILGIDDIKEFVNGDYEPPKEHGLSNCNVIIPSYYNLHKNPSKITQLDYFEIIKDDIRNYRALNEYQLKYIKELSHECKNELFDIFNQSLHILTL